MSASLGKELDLVERMEDFSRAEEINKSIEFYKKIKETMRLEDLKKKHETNVQVTKNQLLSQAKSIELQYNQEIKSKEEEYASELASLKAKHKQQSRALLKEHMTNQGVNLQMVPEIVQMEMTLKILLKEKKYGDVKYLRRLKEQREKEILEEGKHKAKEALRNKLSVMKAKQAAELRTLRAKFEEFVAEKKAKKEKSLAQHKKASQVKMLNTCSSNIKEFNTIDKRVRNATMDNKKPVESKYKYYGSDIKTRSLLRSKQVRTTFVLDILKKAN